MAAPRIHLDEPLGGAALAVAASGAAAALAGVARASTDPGIAAQADALRVRVAGAAERNAAAYAEALAARDASAGLPQERRDWQIGQSFARAAEPPLELARIAADLADLAAAVAVQVDPSVWADAVVAAALAAGVARGAVALVEANLTATPDDPRVAEAKRLAAAAETAAARAAAPGA